MSRRRRVARLALLRAAGPAVTEVGRWLAARPGRRAAGRVDRADRPRILLVRPDHLGDCLLAAPAAEVLRATLPEAHVAWLVGPWSAEVVRRADPGAEVETLEFPGFTRRPKASPVEPYALLWREAGRLRARGYDAALVLRPDHWWGALLTAAAGIPRRFGFAVPECRPFLTARLPPTAGEHVLVSNQRLARLAARRLGGTLRETVLCAPRFAVRPDETAWARAWLQQVVEEARDAEVPSVATALRAGRPVVALHPGSGAAVKSWLPERWAAAVDALRARAGAVVVLTGGPAERAVVEAVTRHLSPAPPALVGDTTLGQLAALFAESDLVLGVDSGPLHLAAAVGTPTVRLYGPTDPAEFGPWPPDARHRWLAAGLGCQPCRDLVAPPCGALAEPACLRAVGVDVVVGVALDLLGARAPCGGHPS